MGATNFGTKVVGKFANAREAFKAAVGEAEEVYGDCGYTGSIAEKSSFMEVSAPRFGTKAFEKYEDKKMDDLDKWGPAICIEIKGKNYQDMKERAGLKGKQGIKAYYFFGWAPC